MKGGGLESHAGMLMACSSVFHPFTYLISVLSMTTEPGIKPTLHGIYSHILSEVFGNE